MRRLVYIDPATGQRESAPTYEISNGEYLRLVDGAVVGGTPTAEVADATGSVKGIVQLTGDLGGTAASPTVPGLAGKSNTGHTHPISDVLELQTELDALQPAVQIKDDGSDVGAAGSQTSYNFTGAGVSATTTGNALTVNIPGGAGEAFPVGSVFIAVVSTSPTVLLGYGVWVAFGVGRVLIGLDALDTDFDTVKETGGAKTVASAGSNAAEAAHTHSVTSNVSVDAHASHTHDYTQVPNHVHGLTTVLRTATTGAATTQVAQAQDTSSTADILRKTDNPDGGVATGTTAGPSASLTHAANNPAVTSGAGSSHNHAFTGSATSVVQPYIVVYMWERTV